jgi:hypothetical protein
VLGALAGDRAQILHASGELIARALELFEARQRGAAGEFRTPRGRGDVGEGPGDDARQLALELCDLRPQRCACPTLADRVLGLGRAGLQRVGHGCIPLAASALGPTGAGVAIDHVLLGMAQARLLSAERERRFYQRAWAREPTLAPADHGCSSAVRHVHSASSA